MKAKEIQAAQALGNEITNFRNCYVGNEIYGEVDGPVSVETLIEFLINNPHFQTIANNIDKLGNEL